MRLAICGHGQHGKGTVAEWLRDNTPLRYHQSTSEAASELVFSQIGAKYGYADPASCFADRRNHRPEWAEIIWRHNQPDGVTLYEDMLGKNDILEGIRQADELKACRRLGIVDWSIWVDAAARVPAEGSNSCKLRASDCDAVLNNNHEFDRTILLLRMMCIDLGIPTKPWL